MESKLERRDIKNVNKKYLIAGKLNNWSSAYEGRKTQYAKCHIKS